MPLDPCVFLWLADAQEMLSPRARQLIADNAASLFISSISAFEIALKHRKGALRLPLSPSDWIAEALEHHGITDIPVDWRVAERSASLPPLHRDPAGRLIVATALTTGLPILTPDPLIKAYDATVFW